MSVEWARSMGTLPTSRRPGVANEGPPRTTGTPHRRGSTRSALDRSGKEAGTRGHVRHRGGPPHRGTFGLRVPDPVVPAAHEAPVQRTERLVGHGLRRRAGLLPTARAG